MDELFPLARDRLVGILARVPLASGLLTGKLTKTSSFAPDDHRNFNREGQAFNVGETFAGLPLERGVELVEEIRWIAEGRESMARAALRWVLDHAEITSVIPGFKSARQVEDNLGAAEVRPFDEDELRRLAGFYTEHVEPSLRGPL